MSGTSVDFDEAWDSMPAHAAIVDEATLSDLTCVVCQHVVNKARSACSNVHVFCAECIDDSCIRGTAGPKCPTCREDVSLYRGMYGKPVPWVDTLISSHYAKCVHGCDATVKLSNMREHDKVCQEKVVKCPFHGIGCSYRGKRSEIQAHLDSSTTVHLGASVDDTVSRLQDIKWEERNIKRMVQESSREVYSVTTEGFEDVCKRVEAVENKLAAVSDALGLLVETLVLPCKPAAPAKATRGGGSSAKQPMPPPPALPHNRKAAVLKRLRDGSTPPGRQAAVSPQAPGAPPRGMRPCPLPAVSPTYSVTSPSYSPTSPSYSPTSLAYTSLVHSSNGEGDGIGEGSHLPADGSLS